MDTISNPIVQTTITAISTNDNPKDHTPPAGRDERRLQVRAYNIWASLLDGSAYPKLSDLAPETVKDFVPNSVLMDFTDSRDGIRTPNITHIGNLLLTESGAEHPITSIADVPSHSLLSQITGQYQQIFTNEAPIAFEADFVNNKGATILCRGILLPFSSDGDQVDYIYGVINWKECSPRASGAVVKGNRQLHGALPKIEREHAFLTEWADGPADQPALQSSELIMGYADMGIADDSDFALLSEAPALMEGLRALPSRELASVEAENEFVVLVARRLPNGEIKLVGEVNDESVTLRAARKLLG